ncbi:MAG: HAMP domain-containing histidine kinase [Desulfobacteraceae bacterium]|nr:HAMP domain-containing histidine kinase [Desulfobacteraceae bacterium]
MAKDENILAEEGMRFFGTMSASATHEIKNALAIINENAGLLEDLSMGHENGHAFSPERGNDISQRLARQVKRADFVLNKLNRLSHSVDLVTQITDLEEVVCFVLDMSVRLVEQKEVIIEVTSPLSSVIVDTNLFFLENMIWRAVETACAVVIGEKKVMISFGNDVTTPSIWFSMSHVTDNLKNNSVDEFFRSKGDQALMTYLDISIEKNNENNSFGFLWPKRI